MAGGATQAGSERREAGRVLPPGGDPPGDCSVVAVAPEGFGARVGEAATGRSCRERVGASRVHRATSVGSARPARAWRLVRATVARRAGPGDSAGVRPRCVGEALVGAGGGGMLTLPLATRVLVCREPIDMRRSFDGLEAAVRDRLAEDPLSG